MKQLFGLSSHRSIVFILFTYAVIILLAVVWSAQMLEIITRNEPGETTVLLVISILFPVALIILTIVNIVRIVRQRRLGTPGSRLRLQLITSFAAIVVFTAVPLGVFSVFFLRTAIGLWLAPGTGQALEKGYYAVLKTHDDSIRQLRNFAESNYFKSLILDQQMHPSELWSQIIDVAPYVGAIQYKGPKIMEQMGDSRLFRSVDEFTNLPGSGALPRLIINQGVGVSWSIFFADMIIVLSSSLPRDFDSQVRLLTSALDDWNRYERLQPRIGRSLTLFGIFLSGPLIFMSLLIGIALSDRVIRPLVALGEATTRITEGDLSVRVISPREDELAFLTESFNRMIRELEVSRTKLVQTEKVGAWQVIAQRLTHELRNPLTPIKLSAQRIQRKVFNGDVDAQSVSRSMDIVLQEIEGLDKLLRDFRDFAGGGVPHFAIMCLRPMLKEMIEHFQVTHPSIKWEMIPGESDPPVFVDAHQIRQVLVNILNNAIEAKAQLITTRLDLVYRGTTPYARIQIWDDGEGIADMRNQTVFQPYHSTKEQGSGLGLSVAHRIIYDHQGRIWFESAIGEGTVFYIDIPMREKE